MAVYLERAGIDTRAWDIPDEPEPSSDRADSEDLGEEVVRQVIGALDTDGRQGDQLDGEASTIAPRGIAPTPPPLRAAPPAPAPLPSIDDIKLTLKPEKGLPLRPRSQSWASSGGSGGWTPRTGAEVERDSEVGRRGEQLVYQMELERVRRGGHPDPESVVIWTSQIEAGADHDIHSVDDAGQPRWIEVKSTTGDDGRFDWSRKEFEKAMRERERYELWRVYRAGSAAPIAKCFRDPARMVGAATLQLELGNLRACVEGIE